MVLKKDKYIAITVAYSFPVLLAHSSLYLFVCVRGIILGFRQEVGEMKTNVANKDIRFEDYALTRHALQRMGTRGFSATDVNLVLAYGRKIHTRGAMIYVVGRKEIVECSSYGVDLSSLDGVQVVQQLVIQQG